MNTRIKNSILSPNQTMPGNTGPYQPPKNNGTIMAEVIVTLARLAAPALGDWIEANVSFPNSMVDCIVPATGPRELALAQELGIDDKVPVTHENFRQWVIEDRFCAGRPPWEEVGATITDEVHDYEAMKLRILNGGHQIIAAPAEICSMEMTGVSPST